MEDSKPQVLFMDEALDFINSLPDKVRRKVVYNIRRVENGEINAELFEKLNDKIWEFRTIYNITKYRLLAFWDIERRMIIIATHGFTKKTQKTPAREITGTESLRRQYINN